MANESALLDDPTEIEVDEAPSLRETLEAAVEEHAPAEPSTSPAPPATEAAPVTEAKPAATPPVAPQAPAAQPQAPAAPGTELKAPAQWKPAVRDKWTTLPREVQEEILRRESDSMRLIGSVGPKIRIADQVMTELQPYAERLQANGVNPMAFIGDMFQSVKSLSSGSAQDKAEVIANIVQSYGVDLQMLDSVLSRRVSAPPEVLEARRVMARAHHMEQQNQQYQQHQTSQQADQVIAEFAADPKHEFLDDVRDLMADLIEAGRANNLADAYAAAIWAHPDTRKILLQREAQSRAAVKTNRAVAARKASSAVSGSPTLPGGSQINPDMSLREAIVSAIDEHSSL
jgi:hypothetical protein